ncbi:MAG TPA: peptide ABC transporter substrate-binding protein, partial [Ktedonobacteraceae bacterium]|nr:peptide ABC transporter substrate-binding protein [Ktedonobacteraceae bacterium]
DDKENIQPQLASSWDVSSDKMTYTFHLRPNLVFSDGTPLTSADVAYSIDRALQPSLQSTTASYYMKYIKDSDQLAAGKIKTIINDSIKTPDASTVAITLNKPVPFFLDTMTFQCSYVIEKSLFIKYGKSWTDHLSEGGGDGPFTVQSYTHSKQIVFVPNPKYYGTKPQLQKVIFPFYKVQDTAYPAYQVGQLDEAPVPLAHYLADKNKPDFHVIPQLWISYYTMNYNQKPFDNTKIRQAFELAINKDLIVKDIWKGSIIATNHIVPQGMYGYNPNLTGPDNTPGTAGDVTKAKALFQQGLSEEGYSSVSAMPPITLTYSSAGIQAARDEVATMQQMWQTVLGVSVKTNDVEINKLFADEGLGTQNPLQFYTGPAWIADYPDPYDWTSLQFAKGAAQNGMNFGQNNGPDAAAQQAIQTQLAQADVMQDPQARLQAYNNIEQQLVNYVAWFPMEQNTFVYRIQPCVQGWLENAQGQVAPDDWGRIFISTDQPCAKTS